MQLLVNSEADLKSYINVVVPHVWHPVSNSMRTKKFSNMIFWQKYKLTRPDEVPLSVLTESGRVGFPAVHRTTIPIIHG